MADDPSKSDTPPVVEKQSAPTLDTVLKRVKRTVVLRDKVGKPTGKTIEEAIKPSEVVSWNVRNGKAVVVDTQGQKWIEQ